LYCGSKILHKTAKHNKTWATWWQKFVLRTQNMFSCKTLQKKFVLHTKKTSLLLQKIAFVLQKKQLAHFLMLYALLLSFWHTFSYFPILSKLLAHCAFLSKSEGQLCCCHETGLKPVLFLMNWCTLPVSKFILTNTGNFLKK